MYRVERQIWQHIDIWLLSSVVLVIVFGIAMIQSAIAGNIELDGFHIRQLIFACLGLVILLITAGIDYHYWFSASVWLYIVIIGALVILNLIAPAVFGSARWFQFLQITIQPSELAKVILILVVAAYIERNRGKLSDLQLLLRSFFLAFGIIFWVFLQPSLSTSIILAILWFCQVWASGIKLKTLTILATVGIILILILAPVLIQTELIQPYQLSRVTSFLFPDPDARFGDEYNVQQALISIGSGGLFGQGYGQGTQVQGRFLKVRHSDFIFSVIAHELGFVGTILILALLSIIVWRCVRAAQLAPDFYGALLAFGIATLIASQAAINISVNLRLIPATGQTLPFISYGGSSLVTNMIAIGIVQSVVMRRRSRG